MDTVVGFLRGLWGQPPLVRAWVGLLMLVHGAAPFAFLPERGAVAMLGAFALSSLTMAVLYGAYGFARILGAAHAWWVPALAWMGWSWWSGLATGTYGTWVVVALVTGTVSLGLDVVDVVRWVRGEREPTVGPPG